MLIRLLRWLVSPRRGLPRQGRRRLRPLGCLLWALGLIIAVIVLALLLGGFQKGTKAGGGDRPGGEPITAISPW